MYWELYQTLLVLAGLGTGAVLIGRVSIIPTGSITGGLWAVLALQARNIEIYEGVSGSTIVGSESWQFLSLGLSLLMLGAVALHYWGVFPPEKNTDTAATFEANGPDNDIR